jgi:hypothetical protein
MFLRHPEKGLVGVLLPPQQNGGSVTVHLEPGAAVTGRLVGADGRPRAGVELEVSFRLKDRRRSWDSYFAEQVQTDGEGRFRVEALLPGYQFRLADGKGVMPFSAPPAGQTKDLGDVRLKPDND